MFMLPNSLTEILSHNALQSIQKEIHSFACVLTQRLQIQKKKKKGKIPWLLDEDNSNSQRGRQIGCDLIYYLFFSVS